ncbi:MAG: SRPBCC domain-containing protein [Actinobacteria bacterium]|nr:SRPBCC domain-containing protein [Actinomycetota bacterium]MCI0544848.1 SRPBCC domain-containing protein [Actinomycetota bacterium]MCI0678465.1 SRPBCC domain-containing protein [Actinomycetota bacterium]
MTEITVEQRVDAAPSTVYRYLTEPGMWATWQGEEATVEPWAGGRFSMLMSNGSVAEGVFVELVPDTRVVFTWGWVGHPTVPPGSTTVEIALHEEERGTRVVLTHRSLPAEEVELHRSGWQHYLPRLAVAAKGGDPGPESGVKGPDDQEAIHGR